MEPSFEELVADALDTLPPEISARMDNVEVVIEDEPPPDELARLEPGSTLLGHYHGIPLTERGDHYTNVLPDRISIYEGPLRRMCRDAEEIKEQVRITVVHEIAHHFGIDDDRLDELGY